MKRNGFSEIMWLRRTSREGAERTPLVGGDGARAVTRDARWVPAAPNPCAWIAFGIIAIAGFGCGDAESKFDDSTTISSECIPSKSSMPVAGSCGLFVSASKGSDDNEGSQDKPLATIGRALLSPRSEPIYVCAETLAEAVYVEETATVFGGLDCANGWNWIGATTKTEISPAAGQVPLVVSIGGILRIEDVTLRAKDAEKDGGSSVAVIATVESALDLVRCDIEAGAAKDGAPGAPFPMRAAAGTMGNPGAAACTSASADGGASVVSACDDPTENDDSVSGPGGVGQPNIGGNGSPGTPLGAMNGGEGQLSDVSYCAPGGAGEAGSAGARGVGAAFEGSLTGSGFGGDGGRDGDKGKPGQGGGGGGGAKGGIGAGKCSNSNNGGASGGSGGSGGCGGAGGRGGQAAGASIGIVSLGAKLSFDDVKITTKNGGNGGNGGDGQLGGDGVLGGPGGPNGGASSLDSGCYGGKGGDGGPGGKGGGGLGGHSIGIAYEDDAPSIEGVAITIGVPGIGGTGDGDMGAGPNGFAAETHSF